MNKKIDKAALASRILSLEGISSEEKSALLELLNEQKRYGLVWEDSPEEVEALLREKLPVLTEDTTKRLLADTTDEVPNHILIEGDNYPALVALQYAYEGKVDVIYIDPPYNTGNKDFVYNDSYVDSEDSYRHSKWLSFMSKRLRIAKRLLSDRGVIFISIDDNEQANLKLLCDEIFGFSAFYTCFAWVNSQKETLDDETKFAGANLGKIKKSYESVLVYCKDRYVINPDPGTSKYIDKLITNGTNAISSCIIPQGVRCVEPITKTIKGRVGGDNDYYDIISGEGMIIEDGILQNDVIISGPLRNAHALNRFFNGETIIDHKGQKLVDVYLSKTGMLNTRKLRAGNIPSTVLVGKGTAKNGTLLLKEIFNGKSPFDFSKPIELVKYLVSKQRGENSLILDFFAGSGTTLHATMQLNAEDGGKRQCILVTNNENNICEEVTYERNKRVIQGYTTPKGQQVEGLKNNNLRYYKVDFVDREKTAANQKELMKASTDLLCIKENLYQEENCFEGLKLHPQIARYFTDGVIGGSQMLVIYEPNAISVIVKRIEQMTVVESNPIKVYVMAEGQYPYTEDFESVLSKVELRAMPHALYQAMRQVLPPPAEAENTEPEMEVSEEEADGSIYKSEEL